MVPNRTRCPTTFGPADRFISSSNRCDCFPDSASTATTRPLWSAVQIAPSIWNGLTPGALLPRPLPESTPEFTDPDALIDIVQVHRIPFRILTAENAATTQTNRQANCQHHQQAGVPPAHHEFSERPIAACSTVARPIADCTASSFISA